jgi:hypothetical protein
MGIADDRSGRLTGSDAGRGGFRPGTKAGEANEVLAWNPLPGSWTNFWQTVEKSRFRTLAKNLRRKNDLPGQGHARFARLVLERPAEILRCGVAPGSPVRSVTQPAAFPPSRLASEKFDSISSAKGQAYLRKPGWMRILKGWLESRAPQTGLVLEEHGRFPVWPRCSSLTGTDPLARRVSPDGKAVRATPHPGFRTLPGGGVSRTSAARRERGMRAEPAQPRISWMTFAPSTPLSLASRPWNFTLKESWRIPRRSSIVAWRSCTVTT